MKTSRSVLIWAALSLCGVMVLGAMSWLTRDVLASEKTRMEAESRADLEERTRLALWRMDAVGASIASIANRHPAADYEADSTAFLTESEPWVNVHFTLREGGELFSPETKDAADKLENLRVLLSKNPMPGDEWSLLKSAADASENARQTLPNVTPRKKAVGPDLLKNSKISPNRRDEAYQNNSNDAERIQRAKTVENTILNSVDMAAKESKRSDVSELPSAASNASGSAVGGSSISAEREQINEIGTMRAVWIGENLFLLRKLTTSLAGEATRSVQGVWLDPLILKKHLLAEVSDLFPNADLKISENAEQDPLVLVSFPFHLSQNETVSDAKPAVNLPLLVGWAAVLIALLTASLLVHGVMKLSERRASFVSAVTHELRTPLTTFRLYSDMLESGVVKAEKRGEYLRVLSREADRLAHLVENVLSFSKIERGSARSSVRESSVTDLLEPMRERLEARLAAADLSLEITIGNETANRSVLLDNAAVEHILFNLIDNAAKYATASDPPRVEIRANIDRHWLEIIVADHGPGIVSSERRRIFRAFHKSAREAAESRPGVGLGLALSRRLAKSLSGGLEYMESRKGASFILRLPVVKSARI